MFTTLLKLKWNMFKYHMSKWFRLFQYVNAYEITFVGISKVYKPLRTCRLLRWQDPIQCRYLLYKYYPRCAVKIEPRPATEHQTIWL